MENMKHNFRKRLLESEQFNPDLRDKYNREVKMLFEKKLTAPKKLIMIALIPVMLVQLAFFIYAEFALALPLLARVGFGIGILFSLAFALLLFSIVRRGTINIKSDANWYTGLIWILTIIMIMILMAISGNITDTTKGIYMLLNGLVFLIFGVVYLLQNNINQAQLRTQEKLFEIQLSLAEMKEMLEKK